VDTAFDHAKVMVGTRHCTAVAVPKLQNIQKQHYTANVKEDEKPTADLQIYFRLKIFLVGTTSNPNKQITRITVAVKMCLLQSGIRQAGPPWQYHSQPFNSNWS